MNRGRVINRGERRSTLSVKELRQMFEELTHASVAISSDCAAKRRSYPTLSNGHQNVRIKATILQIQQRTNEKVIAGGQTSKPAPPKVDINHVRNRKEFFENQVHAIENSIVAKKAPADNPSSTSRYSSHKPGGLSHSTNTNKIKESNVKSRRTSERNFNGTDSNVSPPPKSLELTKQHAKSSPNLNLPSLSNGYTNKKSGVMRNTFNETNDIQPKPDRKISRNISNRRNKPVYRSSKSTEDRCETTPSGMHVNSSKDLESKVSKTIDKADTIENNEDVIYDIIAQNTVESMGNNEDVVYDIITQNTVKNKENNGDIEYDIITQNTVENKGNIEDVEYDINRQNTVDNLHERKVPGKPGNNTFPLDNSPRHYDEGEWEKNKFKQDKRSTEEPPEEYFSEKIRSLIRSSNHTETKDEVRRKDAIRREKDANEHLQKEYFLSKARRSFRRSRDKLTGKAIYSKEKVEKCEDMAEGYSFTEPKMSIVEPDNDKKQNNESIHQQKDNLNLALEFKDSTNEFDDDTEYNDEVVCLKDKTKESKHAVKNLNGDHLGFKLKSNNEPSHKPIKHIDKIVYPKERNATENLYKENTYEEPENNITRTNGSNKPVYETDKNRRDTGILKSPYEDYLIVLSEETSSDIIHKNKAKYRRDEDLNERDLYINELDNDAIQESDVTQKNEAIYQNVEDVAYLPDNFEKNIKQYGNKKPRNIICGGYGKNLNINRQSGDGEPTPDDESVRQNTLPISRDIIDITSTSNQKNNNTKQRKLENYTTNEENKDYILDHHIDECISDVNEAFQSIHILSNQPKWTILDIAKRQADFRLEDLDDENMFGSFLGTENDFCVETVNSGSETVLFKIRVDREVLRQETEYDEVPANDDVDYTQDETFGNAEVLGQEREYDEVPADNDVYYTQDETLGNTENEEAQYCTIDEVWDNEEAGDLNSTIFDDDQNPRIEIIRDNRNEVGFMPQLNIPSSQYAIVRELIEAEHIYLMKTRFIIDNYLLHFRNLNISPDIEIVFGNIEEIYNVTEKFHLSIRQCNSIEEMAMVFLKNGHIFNCYTRYIRNKSRSFQYANTSFRELLQRRQLQLEDHYTSDSYLLNPVQIPGTYKFLLQKLQAALHKNGESCKSLNDAIELLNEKICETNTAIAIDSIKSCPVNLEQMGSLLIKDTLNIKRKYKSVIFLFQGIVVFCVEDMYDPNFYEYVESIEMNKLALKHCNSAMNFQLSCFDKSRRYSSEDDYIFDIEAPSMTAKEKWVDEIQRILWEQLQYHKDQQRRSTLGLSEAQIAEEENIYQEIPFANTSNQSVPINENPEYHVIEDDAMYEECNAMSGTFFDKDENPRIEIIPSEFQTENEIYMKNVPKSQALVIKELINTEETYLKIMKRVISDYLLYFRKKNINSDIETVFGNIEDICKETEKFYSNLRDCDSVDKVAKLFLKNEHIFDMYIHYMRNKSASYNMGNTKFKELIKNRQIELEDQSTCDSYLLNPIQRPGRYKLMLEKLQKELSKTGESCKSLNKAIALVDNRITEANTLMTIDSIKECPLQLRKMGALKLKEIFNIKRKYKSVVFLFEEIVVFCKENPSDSVKYIYADSIEMAKLSISFNPSSTSFQLRNFDKSKSGEESKYTFDIEAPSISVKEQWTKKIEDLLWGQLQYCKDQQKKSGLNSLVRRKSKGKKMKEKPRTSDRPSSPQGRSKFYL